MKYLTKSKIPEWENIYHSFAFIILAIFQNGYVNSKFLSLLLNLEKIIAYVHTIIDDCYHEPWLL